MIQLNWYKIFGVQIPDGSTVLPTDDIQIWLHCANICDKSYTTLAEVLADTTTLSALISSNNAVDYMVRSTSWTKREPIVPVMTSNTTPAGYTASASSYDGTYEPYKAFNDDVNFGTIWRSASGEPQWVQCEFSEPKVINKIRFGNSNGSGGNYIKGFKVYGVNNSTPTEIYSDTCVNHNATYIENFEFTNSTKYDGYRFEVLSSYVTAAHKVVLSALQFYSPEGICDSSTAMSYIGLNNYCANKLLADATWRTAIWGSAYKTSVLNVKNPTMTDNTHPSGVVFASSVRSSSYDSWRAFDGNTSTIWQCYGIQVPQYLGYQFTSSAKLVGVRMWLFGVRKATAKFQCSNDNVTWVDVTEDISINVTANQWIDYIFTKNISDYSYVRIYFSTIDNFDGANRFMDVGEMDIYGREDV